MSIFHLALLDCRGAARFEKVTQFIGADATGSFGILAGHAPMVAILRHGLARFLDDAGRWHYLALPGGVLRFGGNAMSVITVRYFLGDEPGTLVEHLEQEMAREDSELSTARQSLAKIDQSLLRRLAELDGRGEMARQAAPRP